MTTAEHSVWLPFPPSTNNLFSQGVVKGKVRRFPSKKYKSWRRDAVILILAAKLPRFTEPVVVKLELTPRDNRARDADNYCKPVLDALVEARVLIDDSNRFVKSVIPYWENPAAEHGVRVLIRSAKNARRPALSATERKTLARIKRDGCRLVVGSRFRATNSIRSLLQKGYIRELPGLFRDCPQGWALAD